MVLLYGCLVFSLWKDTMGRVSHLSLRCSKFLILKTSHFKDVNFMDNSMSLLNTKIHVLLYLWEVLFGLYRQIHVLSDYIKCYILMPYL